MTERPNQFKILLSDEEREVVKSLAKDRGLTPTDYIRTILILERDALVDLKRRRVSPVHFSHQVTLERHLSETAAKRGNKK